MTNETKHTPEAEALADAILKAAGSGLRYHTMHKTREAIFTAAQQGIDAARVELLDALDDLECEASAELYPTTSLNIAIAKARAAIAKATSATPTGQAA